MGYIVRMPKMGMSMDEGTVVEWKLEEGEPVDAGDVVTVVESEKASNDVEAREDGVLRRIVVPEGGVVEPGDPIGILADPDEDVSELERRIEDFEPSEGGTEEGEAGTAGGEGTSGSGAEPAPGAGAEEVDATPGARKLAAEHDVRLAAVEGTGPQGVITEDDLERHLESPPTTAGNAARTVVETRELSAIQRTIADRLSESARNAVHVTLHRSFDVTALRRVRSAARDLGREVSITDLLLKSAGRTLEVHPEFNAIYADGEHRLIDEVNVGVAVDVDDGLVTPVVPEVPEKTAEEVRAVRSELTDRVLAGDFTMDALSGATFTISNLGTFGVDHFDPIIDPPQISILGVGRSRADGTMTLSLSFDHRVVNGADAARFLDTLCDTLTDRSTLARFFEADVETDGFDAREVRAETAEGLSGRYRTAYGDVRFDEPADVGGTGSAPSPVDHLLGALGSCLSLSVRQLAERDDVETGSIACDVTGAPEEGAPREIHVALEIETDADEAAVDEVVEKAERGCYVARTLSDDLAVSLEWTRA